MMLLRKQEPKENGPHWLPRHCSPPPGSASLPLGTSPPSSPTASPQQFPPLLHMISFSLTQGNFPIKGETVVFLSLKKKKSLRRLQAALSPCPAGLLLGS